MYGYHASNKCFYYTKNNAIIFLFHFTLKYKIKTIKYRKIINQVK